MYKLPELPENSIAFNATLQLLPLLMNEVDVNRTEVTTSNKIAEAWLQPLIFSKIEDEMSTDSN